GPIGTGGLTRGLAIQGGVNLTLLPVQPGGAPASDRTPLFKWDVGGTLGVISQVYVSTFPGGQGLFPGDIIGFGGGFGGDANRNRIVNEAVVNLGTSYQLPAQLQLTAGQTYYWGVKVTTPDGHSAQKWAPF